MPSGSNWSKDFIKQFSDDEFRQEFVADQVRSRIALMIRALREQADRGWTQAELGEKANKPQNVISRLENPDYGKESLQTLLEIAAAYDLPLLVDIPDWGDWFRRMSDMSPKALEKKSFDLLDMLNHAEDASDDLQYPKDSDSKMHSDEDGTDPIKFEIDFESSEIVGDDQDRYSFETITDGPV